MALATVLAIRGLRKRFGGLEVLRSVDLTVDRGELCALIGPNGAGKTTLLNVVCGVWRANAGEVSIQDHPVHRRLPPHAVARLGVSRTFQTEHFFDELTVLQNVMLPVLGRLPLRHWLWERPATLRDATGRALAALERAGAAGWANEAIGALSQGMRRLVDFARALVLGPVLLLLDEPLAGLNPEEIPPVMDALHRVREDGCAILLVEHNMQAVMANADRVAMLHGGRIIADGPPALVSGNPEVIAAYLGSRSGRA